MNTYRGPDFDALARTDPELAAVGLGELGRPRGGRQPIASENLTSPAEVAETVGTPGYPR